MAGKNPAPNNDMMRAQENNMMRQALLATAPRMRKNVATVVATNGTTSRIKLFNVGVLTKLQIQVDASITIGTATATPSPKAPFNLIDRIKLTDYDGTDRVNFSGFQLYVLNCVRHRSIFGYNNSAAVAAAQANPVVPTAVGNATLRFFLDIPVAFDVENPVMQLQDLRGAILAQTAVGEMYLSIDWNPTLYQNGNCDAVYNGAATTTVVGNPTTNFITCILWQEYLLPQAIGPQGQLPLPGIDLMTVYELAGNLRSSDNLAVNTEKLINYPNVRTVIGAYANYVQATAIAAGLLNTLRLIANGNNIVREQSERSQNFNQRCYLYADSDIIGGAYWNTHRDKPIETALYGNFQWGLTPNTVGATPYVEVGFESFYTKGQALPGLQSG
jgi:hypothetical protein